MLVNMLLALISLLILTLAAAPHALALKWAWDGEVNPGSALARIVVGLPNLFYVLLLIMSAIFAMMVEVEALNRPVQPKKTADAAGKPAASNDTTLTGSSATVENYVNAAQVVGGRMLGVSA